MKTRTGFVSNSSSSSFVLNTNFMTPAQHRLILDHTLEGERLAKEALEAMDLDPDYECPLTRESLYWLIGMQGDAWSIQENETRDLLHLYTWMDNFPMIDFFALIGLHPNAIVYQGEWYGGDEF